MLDSKAPCPDCTSSAHLRRGVSVRSCVLSPARSSFRQRSPSAFGRWRSVVLSLRVTEAVSHWILSQRRPTLATPRPAPVTARHKDVESSDLPANAGVTLMVYTFNPLEDPRWVDFIN